MSERGAILGALLFLIGLIIMAFAVIGAYTVYQHVPCIDEQNKIGRCER